MKFWQKFYLFSLLLVIFAISITGIILIQNLHNKPIQTEINTCITEEKLLAYELQMEDTYFETQSRIDNDELKHSLDKIIEDYLFTTPCKGQFQILDVYNKILFTDSNFPTTDTSEILGNLSSNTANFIIKEFNHKKYIYICGLSQSQNVPVKVVYAKDISAVYAERHAHYIFFAKLALWISFIFSVFMFFISKLLTSPIEKFAITAEKISAGDYSERVQIHSKDEFNVLSIQFNKMAETIESKITELERSNESKEIFIHNFTHELKTPLTSIIGYADLIRTSKYNENLFFECADYIYKQAKQLEQLAFKLMDLIYAKSGKLALKIIDLSTLIDEIQLTFKSKLEAKQINLNINLEVPTIVGDQILMKMLLSNLIDNGIKASHANTFIDVSAIQIDGHVIISIQDYGIGISKEHLDKLCQPFYIVDPSRTKKHNGAGIGLSICQKIAEAHGGKLQIESNLGTGTKISLIFNS